MPGIGARLAASQHLVLALLSAWLIVTSPWVHMFRRIPRNAGFLDYSHIVLGLVATLFAVTFTVSCLQGGRWRGYFPWLAGEFAPTGRDFRRLWKRDIPSNEGGGLFGAIKGLLLAALLATAATGVAWLVYTGSPEAVGWREAHLVAARAMAVLLVLHIIAASLHLVEFIRE
jgi:hypothetical protein